MILVADTSPLIALAVLDKLELLDQLFGNAIISESVFQEVTVKGKPFADKLDLWGNSRRRRAGNASTVAGFRLLLGAGEAESIVLCLELDQATLLIDEKKGRRVAKLNGVKIIGTVGVLVLAKKKGMINAVMPLVVELEKAGLRISGDLKMRIAKLADEESGDFA